LIAGGIPLLNSHAQGNAAQIDEVIAAAIAREALAAEHARRAAWRRAEESAASFVAVQAP